MKIEASIRQKIEDRFQPVHFDLENESHMHSGNRPETHFKAVVVSRSFEGRSRVERHRMINELFDQERSEGLHAFSMRAYTPDEWEKVRDEFEMNSPLCHTKKS